MPAADSRVRPSEWARREVTRRDMHTCRWCLDPGYQHDHYPTTWKMGLEQGIPADALNHPANLVLSCLSCNAGRGNAYTRPPGDPYPIGFVAEVLGKFPRKEQVVRRWWLQQDHRWRQRWQFYFWIAQLVGVERTGANILGVELPDVDSVQVPYTLRDARRLLRVTQPVFEEHGLQIPGAWVHRGIWN